MKYFKKKSFNLGIVLISGLLIGCGSSESKEDSGDSKEPETIQTVESAIDEITKNGILYETVVSSLTQRVWLDRNLGASEVCTSLNDEKCYGDYYQWGRNTDGHEKHLSKTEVLAQDVSDVGHSDFISNSVKPHDWADVSFSDGSIRSFNWVKIDGTSVCPTGFRVPTMTEIEAETTDATTIVTNNTDAFNSFLKLPTGGARSYSGSIFDQASEGNIWSSQVNTTKSEYLNFDSYGAGKAYAYRGTGLNVRCIKSN